MAATYTSSLSPPAFSPAVQAFYNSGLAVPANNNTNANQTTSYSGAGGGGGGLGRVTSGSVIHNGNSSPPPMQPPMHPTQAQMMAAGNLYGSNNAIFGRQQQFGNFGSGGGGGPPQQGFSSGSNVFANTTTSAAPPLLASSDLDDISNPSYTPPLWVRLNAAAHVMHCAAAAEDSLYRVIQHQRGQTEVRKEVLSTIRERLAALRAVADGEAASSSPFALGGQRKGCVMAAAASADAAPLARQGTTPLEVFGAGALLAAGGAETTTTTTMTGEGGAFGAERAFPILSSGAPMTPPPAVSSPLSADPQLLSPVELVSSLPPTTSPPLQSIASDSQPTSASTSQQPSVVSDAMIAVNNNASASLVTVPALLDLSREVAAYAHNCAERISGSIQHTDRMLAIFGSEYKGRDAIVAEEAFESGWGQQFINGTNNQPYDVSSNNCRGLVAVHHGLLALAHLRHNQAVLDLSESNGRMVIQGEYGTFYNWAAQSEPQWRQGAQQLTDERLALERAAEVAQEEAREAERKRALALEAIANEKATAEARRVEEVARLRAAELTLAKQVAERREAELAAAAALKEKIEREERQRKDNEYAALLQAEEEINHRMQQRREEEAAAALRKQQMEDEQYAKLLQQQIDLEGRLRDEEEALKARVAAAERQQQLEKDERHAKLLAAEEEARAAYESRQQQMAKEKAAAEEAERAKERERERVRLEMIAAAKAEEERLRLAQLHRVMTSKSVGSEGSSGHATVHQPHTYAPQPMHYSAAGGYPHNPQQYPQQQQVPHTYYASPHAPQWQPQYPQQQPQAMQNQYHHQPQHQVYVPQPQQQQPQQQAVSYQPQPHQYAPQAASHAYQQQQHQQQQAYPSPPHHGTSSSAPTANVSNTASYTDSVGRRVHYDPNHFAPLR